MDQGVIWFIWSSKLFSLKARASQALPGGEVVHRSALARASSASWRFCAARRSNSSWPILMEVACGCFQNMQIDIYIYMKIMSVKTSIYIYISKWNMERKKHSCPLFVGSLQIVTLILTFTLIPTTTTTSQLLPLCLEDPWWFNQPPQKFIPKIRGVLTGRKPPDQPTSNLFNLIGSYNVTGVSNQLRCSWRPW